MRHTQTPLNDQLGPLVTRFGHHRVVWMIEGGGVLLRGKPKKLNFVIFCPIINYCQAPGPDQISLRIRRSLYNCKDEISGGAIEISGGATTKLLKLIY